MISVVVLTKNNEKTIGPVLESVKDFPEIILLDSGSIDATCKIALNYPQLRLFHSPWKGFGKMRNEAALLATHDWILALDSDEVLSSMLQKEILTLSLDKKKVYDIPFFNYYNGKKITCCGWSPESHVRLYHRRETQFTEALVHERLMTNHLTCVKLTHPIYHFSYSSIEDFINKMQLYSSLFAKQNKHKKKSSFFHAIFHGFWAFFKAFFLQKGLFEGKEGWIISWYQANTAFCKYLKLLEENRK